MKESKSFRFKTSSTKEAFKYYTSIFLQIQDLLTAPLKCSCNTSLNIHLIYRVFKNPHKNMILKFCAWFSRLKEPLRWFYKAGSLNKRYLMPEVVKLYLKMHFVTVFFTSMYSIITNLHIQTKPNREKLIQKVSHIHHNFSDSLL